jgi:hypothetical protein
VQQHGPALRVAVLLDVHAVAIPRVEQMHGDGR